MVLLKELADEMHQVAVQNVPKVETGEGLIASAKDQDFGVIFGRDATIRSIFRLERYRSQPDPENLAPVKNSLITLTGNQGKVIDDWRDEEPGKIPHELRHDKEQKNQQRLYELKLAGWPVDGTMGNYEMRYYGSIDATPLFVVTASKYLEATGDQGFFDYLNPHIRGAILWMEKYGDLDSDLFIEYSAKNRNALLNQGWKDSGDSIQTSDGKRPNEPIALVEVQGYQYWALMEAAKLYQKRDPKFSNQLRTRASRLKAKFNRDFYIEDQGFFAFALDGNKTQIKDVTSNVGHLLTTGIVDDEKVPKVVARLMQPDIFTPYGIRTLSATSNYYSDQVPQSYHNGGVWPFDNALTCIGLKNEGYLDEALKVRNSVMLAEGILKRGYNILDPELYSVTRNNRLKPYRFAQQPQGWSVDANKEVFT